MGNACVQALVLLVYIQSLGQAEVKLKGRLCIVPIVHNCFEEYNIWIDLYCFVSLYNDTHQTI